ncbi:MFS transporter [Corynebacterium otitidis]|uniref:MFS transporter permease n=1 Tax=Corynebacterium otitidis TaxID=29321 RepID=UPI000E598514|nr:MFS transporter permease [Corynebacterium otitidis]
MISTVVTSSALAVGPVYSALVADASGAPLTAPYIGYGAATALSFVFVALCREVYRPPNERRLAPRVGVPRSILKRFAPNATAVFCAYGTNALFQSLIPLAMIVFGATSQLEMALATAVMLGTSAITQVAVINYGGSRSLAVGLVGMAVSLVGVFPALFWVATVICGVGQGVSFKASLANAVDSALPGDEARTTSMYYLVAYLGTGVPPVIAGLLGGGAAAVSAVAAVVAIIAVATIGYLRAAGQLGYRHG